MSVLIIYKSSEAMNEDKCTINKGLVISRPVESLENIFKVQELAPVSIGHYKHEDEV